MTQPQTPTPLDRLLNALRSIIRGEFPTITFFGTYEYAITATDGTTVDCTPTDPSISLPALNKVPLRADAIATQTPTPGALCHVLFANGDPSKPYCVWTQPSPASATIGAQATSVTIGEGATTLARGPAVTALIAALGTFAGAMASASNFGQVNTAGTALGTALGVLPPATTSVTEAG